jgi:hypothetical protein
MRPLLTFIYLSAKVKFDKSSFSGGHEMGKMRATVFHGVNDIRVEEVESPQAGVGQAVIRLTLTTICGTDLHILRGEYAVVLILGGVLLRQTARTSRRRAKQSGARATERQHGAACG